MKTKKIISTLLVVVMVASLFSTAALAISSSSPEFVISNTNGTGHYYRFICTGNGVNVRTDHYASASSLGYLYQNEVFWHQLDANNNGFCYGNCKEDTLISMAYGYAVSGWVSGDYLQYTDF